MNPTPLHRVLAAYALDQAAKGMNPGELQDRIRVLRAGLQGMDPAGLTPLEVQEAIISAGNLDAARQLYLALVGFYRWAEVSGRLPGDNPMATTPRPTRRPAVTVSASETRRQVEAEAADPLADQQSMAALRAAALAAGGLSEAQRVQLAALLRRTGDLPDDLEEDPAAALPQTVIVGHEFEHHLDGYAGCACGWMSLSRHTVTAARAVHHLHALREVDR